MANFAQKRSASRQSSLPETPASARAPAGQSSVVSSILDLQRTAGNQAVRLLLQGDDPPADADVTGSLSQHGGGALDMNPVRTTPAEAIQTKLAIDEPGDVYEQDADRVAEHVMRAPGRHPGQNEGSEAGLRAAPSIVRDALRSTGRPLDPATRAFMEPRFGYDFSQVRVHVDEAAQQSARELNAHAYAAGRDIVFGAGRFAPGTREGRALLAHELTHVVQQQGSGAPGAQALPVASSGARIARQTNSGSTEPPNAGKMLTDWLLPKPIQPPAPKPPVTRSSDRARRTRVTVAVTGHASPRWKGARSAPQADAFNQQLSRKRENAVRARVETLLREALPDQQLIFEYAPSQPADDPFDLSATVDVESTAVGSQTTLQEAGKAGRSANDAGMRRVDLGIDLSSAIDTVQDTTVHEKRPTSGATRNWSLKMGMSVTAESGAGGGTFNFMLKNRKTGQEAEGWGGFAVAGIGESLPIPTIDMGGYEDFTTPHAVNFSDFDDTPFTIASAGFNALIFGWEWSYMYIVLPGGNAEVDVGGFVMGGAGIDLSSAKGGVIHMRSTPDTYLADVERTNSKAYTSRMTEQNRHRVLFETGEATIAEDQDAMLQAFVNGAVEHYQRGGVYTP